MPLVSADRLNLVVPGVINRGWGSPSPPVTAMEQAPERPSKVFKAPPWTVTRAQESAARIRAALMVSVGMETTTEWGVVF